MFALRLLLVLTILSTAHSATAAAAAAEERVHVVRFHVTGNTVHSLATLRPLLAPSEGRDLTLAEIEAVAERVTALYRVRGYILARAYIPEQEMRDGIVEIAVLEGRVARVAVNGGRLYRDDHLRAYVQPDPPAVFHAQRHERALLLLNDLPGLEVRSTLKPGPTPGTTDIVLDVAKERSVTAQVDADNYGSKATGRERFGVGVNFNNLAGWGDALSFRGLVSRQGEALWFLRCAYSTFLGTEGTRVGAAYTHINAETDVAVTVGTANVRGSGDVGNLYATHPFVRSRGLSVFGQAGFDYKDLSNTVEVPGLGQLVRHDRTRVFNLGGALSMVDRWRGASSALLALHQGVGGFLGGLEANDDPDAGRLGAGGRFTKVTVDLSRLQQLTESTMLFGRASGQWASTGLVATEQFIAGGVGTVRGYPIAEASGDHGYAVTAEFRWNAPGFADAPAFLGKRWGEILQFFVFVDHGGVQLLDPQPGERRTQTLTGAGLGAQLVVVDNFLARLEYARPLGRRPSDGLENVIYFLASKFF